MTQDRRITIVGGGLAELAAANALAAFGCKFEMFEAAPALGEIGAGINTSPQAVKALQAIGLGEKITAVANASPGIYTRNMQTGEPLEAFANFRRIRIPRVHAVQRLSHANAQFKHMRDSAAQKALITEGKRGVMGNAEWVWGYDPVGTWDKEPTVPSIA